MSTAVNLFRKTVAEYPPAVLFDLFLFILPHLRARSFTKKSAAPADLRQPYKRDRNAFVKFSVFLYVNRAYSRLTPPIR